MSFNRIDVNPQPTPAASPSQAVKSTTFQPRNQGVSEPVPQVTVPPRISQKLNSEPVMSRTVTKKVFLMALVGVILLGSLSGAGVAYISRSSGTANPTDTTGVATGGAAQDSMVKVGAIFGLPDDSTFKDDTEGVLILGGIDGEGSHTLLRPGGASQNVYLTSSAVDLNQFENVRVRVWGETFKGQKAGWLMDVGRVEVLEVGAELPVWYSQQQEE